MKYYDTKHLKLNERICVYCGQVCQKASETEDGEKFNYYFCDCDGAKLDIQKQEIQEKLETKEKMMYQRLKDLEYEFELKKLKRRYGKELY